MRNQSTSLFTGQGFNKSWSSSKDTSIVIAACQQWCSPRGQLQIQDDDFIDAGNTCIDADANTLTDLILK
ncbi:hypothetical protein Scep_009617 [Stephania cephalantha]|uniref:Uncharacterized protein n=1 Tax=Stephania cephalantha TaxID=152367 RepID=A0AAP0JTZ2_9MAGN